MVEKNKIYTIKIEGISHQGLGVGRVDGFVIFVHFALPGETVLAKIVKVKKEYAYAIIDKILEVSKERTEPFCPSYKRCGGCSLQHMEYKFQLLCKTNRVKECFERIANIKDIDVKECIGMDYPYHYRNKVQYPVGIVKGQVNAGFYARRTHEIVPSYECRIQAEVFNKIKNFIVEYMKSEGITPYDEISGIGQIRHIVVRRSAVSENIMVIIVVNENNKKAFCKLTEKLTKEFKDITNVILNINTKKTNVIMGDKDICLYGKGYIIDSIGRYRFKISPRSFFQINNLQTKVLYDKIVEFADLKGEETVFDLYCGAGTISIYLSEKAKKVIGVESVAQAVENAKDNAKLNKAVNVEFYEGKSEDVILKLKESGIIPDIVVLDPPRKGCHVRVLEAISEMQPDKIIYVSCNPSTIARDVKVLVESEYVIDKVQTVDMFPHTEHVETVVLMSRVDK